MPAILRRTWLPLFSLACAALALASCKPPEIPATGGLVATNRPGEQPAQPEATSATAAPVAPVDGPPAVGINQPPLERVAPAAPSAPAPSTPIVANPGLIPVDVASSGGVPPAGSQQPQSGSRASGTKPRGVPPIRLSAGIAVPQSLPMGTVMGLSVDYTVFGALDGSSRYVWVVSSQGGGDIDVEQKLAASGTLQAFFLKLRPEHRPFNCRIDEIAPGGRRTAVSNVAAMQTSY